MSDVVRETAKIDPITVEVIRNALLAATEEMGATLRRSAYSTNVKTRADYSCCFFDRDFRVIAQSFAQPVHLGNMVKLVPADLRQYGFDRLEPGDMIVVNDPYLGSIHLNDVTVVAPVFHDGRLFGDLANLAHHFYVDVCGGAPASIGAFREIYQEGVQIPPVRLVAQNEIVDDTFRMILAQIRSKRETAGDFRAQIAANLTGARRLIELLDHGGRETADRTIDALIRPELQQQRSIELWLSASEFLDRVAALIPSPRKHRHPLLRGAGT